MNTLLFNVVDNPILIRELRRRMRGKALFYSIMSYLALMGISTVLILLFNAPGPGSDASTTMLQEMTSTGKNVYYWITGIQVLLVLIIAPTITAGLTTGEKERKTFDFLRVTTITRWMYVMGCFLSTAFYVGLALLCALPLLSISFLYGGVSMHDVASTFLSLLAISFVLSAFGLYISSISERTRTSQGIIVFSIFGAMFGGYLLYQEYRLVFASSTTSVAGLYLFSYSVAPWLLFVFILIFMAIIFLLLAARKLFEPDETRAFSHWQYALLILLLVGSGFGMLSGNILTNEVPELAFLALGEVLLLVGVCCFAVGRTEVGDEIWHMKRLFPALRPFDQTLPFLACVAGTWWIAIHSIPAVAAQLANPAGLYEVFARSSISTFIFFVFVGRAAMGITGSRRIAFRYTVAAMGIVFLLPVVVAVILKNIIGADSLIQEIISASPLAVLVNCFYDPAEYAAGINTGFLSGGVLLAAALAIGVWGEMARWKRWRGFDYHYDMPVG
ncbi:hypothetical protein BH09SUM1_BH09SUM1_08280 [soil metagenome]